MPRAASKYQVSYTLSTNRICIHPNTRTNLYACVSWHQAQENGRRGQCVSRDLYRETARVVIGQSHPSPGGYMPNLPILKWYQNPAGDQGGSRIAMCGARDNYCHKPVLYEPADACLWHCDTSDHTSSISPRLPTTPYRPATLRDSHEAASSQPSMASKSAPSDIRSASWDADQTVRSGSARPAHPYHSTGGCTTLHRTAPRHKSYVSAPRNVSLPRVRCRRIL